MAQTIEQQIAELQRKQEENNRNFSLDNESTWQSESIRLSNQIAELQRKQEENNRNFSLDNESTWQSESIRLSNQIAELQRKLNIIGNPVQDHEKLAPLYTAVGSIIEKMRRTPESAHGVSKQAMSRFTSWEKQATPQDITRLHDMVYAGLRDQYHFEQNIVDRWADPNNAIGKEMAGAVFSKASVLYGEPEARRESQARARLEELREEVEREAIYGKGVTEEQALRRENELIRNGVNPNSLLPPPKPVWTPKEYDFSDPEAWTQALRDADPAQKMDMIRAHKVLGIDKDIQSQLDAARKEFADYDPIKEQAKMDRARLEELREEVDVPYKGYNLTTNEDEIRERAKALNWDLNSPIPAPSQAKSGEDYGLFYNRYGDITADPTLSRWGMRDFVKNADPQQAKDYFNALKELNPAENAREAADIAEQDMREWVQAMLKIKQVQMEAFQDVHRISEAIAHGANFTAKAYGDYTNTRKADIKTFGQLNPFDPISVVRQAYQLQENRLGYQEKIGSTVSSVGTNLIGAAPFMAGINPLAGAITALGGAGITAGGAAIRMDAMKKSVPLQAYQTGLQIFEKIGHTLWDIGRNALSLLIEGAKTLTNWARSAVGSLANLAAIGIGAGVYGMTSAVNNAFNHPINDPLTAIHGISMKELNYFNAMESRFGLGQGAIATSQVNIQRQASRFRTQGILDKQLPSSLAGLINLQMFDSSFNNRVKIVEDIFRNDRVKNSPQVRNDFEEWLHEMGMDTELRVASMSIDNGLSLKTPWWHHRQQEQIERERIRNYGEYQQLQSAGKSGWDDFGNALWTTKIGSDKGYTGREWMTQYDNIIGSLAQSVRQGDPLPTLAQLLRTAEMIKDTLGGMAGKFMSFLEGNPITRPIAGGITSTVAAGKNWLDGLMFHVKQVGKPRWEYVNGYGADGTTANSSIRMEGKFGWKEVFDYIGRGLWEVATNVVGFFKAAFEEVKPILGGLLDSVLGGISKGLSSFFKEGGMADGILNFFVTTIDVLKKKLGDAFGDESLIGQVKGWASAMTSNILRTLEPVIKFVGDASQKIGSMVIGSLWFELQKKTGIGLETSPVFLGSKKAETFAQQSALQELKALGVSPNHLPFGVSLNDRLPSKVQTLYDKWVEENHPQQWQAEHLKKFLIATSGKTDENTTISIWDRLLNGSNPMMDILKTIIGYTDKEAQASGRYDQREDLLWVSKNVPAPQPNAGSDAFLKLKELFENLNFDDFKKAADDLIKNLKNTTVETVLVDATGNKLNDTQINTIFGAYGKIYARSTG